MAVADISNKGIGVSDFPIIQSAAQHLLIVDRSLVVAEVVQPAETPVIGLASRGIDLLVSLEQLIHPSTSDSQTILSLVIVKLCPGFILRLIVSTGILLFVVR